MPKQVEMGEVDSPCGSSGKNTTRGIPPHHVTVLLVYINIRYNYCRRTWYAHSHVSSPLSPLLSGCVGEVLSTPGDVPTVLLDGKNTQSDRREVSRTVLSG